MARRDALLWTAVVAGPAAWFLDLVASFIVDSERTPPLPPLWQHVISAIALALALAGVVIAVVQLRSVPRAERQGDDPESQSNSYRWFLALGAVVLSAGGILLVLGTAIPKWIFHLPPPS